MAFDAGERITFRPVSGRQSYRATVVPAPDGELSLQLSEGLSLEAGPGARLVLSSHDCSYYAEVLRREEQILTVKILWNERREYFRVDDFFPVAARRVQNAAAPLRSCIISGFIDGTNLEEPPDDSINPHLWKMLVNIQGLLTHVLDQMAVRDAGLNRAEGRQVNISASGIKFRTGEKMEERDLVELKFLLPTTPPVGVLLYGHVVRVTPTDEGDYETAVHFAGVEENVREEIINYTLMRQRDMIRKDLRNLGNEDR